jgi:tetratricopeptide (TPR) repeat protein
MILTFVSSVGSASERKTGVQSFTITKPALSLKALLFCILSFFGTHAIGQESQFQEANQAYQKGNPTEAVALYKSLQQSGVEDAALYFNLGNAYAAQGQVGEAILSYVRALRLSPGDEDIRANLSIARRHAAETAEPPRVGPLAVLREEQAAGSKTPTELAQTAFILYSVGVALLMAAVLLRRRGRQSLARVGFVGALFVGGIAAVFAVLSWQQANHFAEDKRAVVLVSNTPVRRGPIETAESLYSLPTGEVVSIEERRGQWGLLRVQERPDGWVLLSQVEPVVP